jgi:hypothetical protein
LALGASGEFRNDGMVLVICPTRQVVFRKISNCSAPVSHFAWGCSSDFV